MPTITTETRKRGPFGWMIAVLFWGWNAFMAWALIGGLHNAAPLVDRATTHLDRVATGAGVTLGVGVLLGFWLLGSLVLGVMMAFTRGKRVSVTREA